MVKSSKIKLRFNALPKQTLEALKYLSDQNWLSKSDWYLAGGTALALQVGFRRSVDLDFFSEIEKFDNEKLLENIKSRDWRTKQNSDNTIYGELFNASVSFISYPFFIPKLPLIKFGSIGILDAKDIAVMKIVALSQRGKKRDFFDLYYCANNVSSLEKIITNLKEQYPTVAHNYQHILKSLIYFADADDDPNPDLLIDLNWTTVKNYFEEEIPKITKKLLDLRIK